MGRRRRKRSQEKVSERTSVDCAIKTGLALQLQGRKRRRWDENAIEMHKLEAAPADARLTLRKLSYTITYTHRLHRSMLFN